MPLYAYFVFTLLIEMPLVLWLVNGNWKEKLLVGFLLNLFTWTLLHLIYLNTNANIYVLEISVALVEAVGYQLFFKNGWVKSMLIAFLANGLSYGVGLLMR
jgi:hypothetical protein